MLIEADWPAPDHVQAFCTERRGGVGFAPFDSFNLGHHVGDDPGSVLHNRQHLQTLLPPGAQLQWLQQEHGSETLELSGAIVDAPYPRADSVFTRDTNRACAVLTADCLPLLLCNRAGTTVAAAHAGWRGLSAGVLERLVERMPCVPDELLAWMGPAIGPRAFEVGPEVRDAFMQGQDDSSVNPDPNPNEVELCFVPSDRRPGHFYADLYQLARQRLRRLGIESVFGGGHCTLSESERFFSHRRDGQTGRMASLILIKPR